MKKQYGFTLMEMVGVIAVIAILASAATPAVMDAIREAKITSFVNQVNAVKSAASEFYSDTGNFPTYVPSGTNDDQMQLMKDTTAGIGGWDGPYLDKEFSNPFDSTAYIGILETNNANYQFDLNGDGTVDTTTVSVIRIDRVSDEEAKKISNLIDEDGDVLSGNGAWNSAGRVKRYGTNSDHAHILLIYVNKT